MAQSASSEIILDDRGTLEVTDLMADDGSLYDKYELYLEHNDELLGARLRITLQSNTFSPYLYVIFPDGDGVRAEDSRVYQYECKLDILVNCPGIYVIKANSFYPEGNGNYRIVVEKLVGTLSTASSYNPPPTIPNAWTNGSHSRELIEAINLYTTSRWKKDSERMRALFFSAAETGDPVANMWKACLVYGGSEFTERNDELALQLTQRYASEVVRLADSGDAEAAYIIGWALRIGIYRGPSGRYTDEETKKIASVYNRMAADAGHRLAMLQLGTEYLSNSSPGTIDERSWQLIRFIVEFRETLP